MFYEILMEKRAKRDEEHTWANDPRYDVHRIVAGAGLTGAGLYSAERGNKSIRSIKKIFGSNTPVKKMKMRRNLSYAGAGLAGLGTALELKRALSRGEEKRASSVYNLTAADWDSARRTPALAMTSRDKSRIDKEMRGLLTKRAAVTIAIPKGHGRSHADTLRPFFEERANKTDEELIKEYAHRQRVRGLVAGGVVGAGLGGGLIPLGFKLGGEGIGEAKDIHKLITKKSLVPWGIGAGALGGALLGGYLGKDRAYHVTEKGLPYLREEQAKKEAEKRDQASEDNYRGNRLGGHILGGTALGLGGALAAGYMRDKYNGPSNAAAWLGMGGGALAGLARAKMTEREAIQRRRQRLKTER
jgi:hypothetical protein